MHYSNGMICMCWILRDDRDHLHDSLGGMQKYLLPYITARFNMGALNVFNAGRMEQRNGRRRSQWTTIWRFRFGVGDFNLEGS